MTYMMDAQVSDLTSRHPQHSFSSPLRAHDGRLIENQGHNTVTDRSGQFYTLYHVGRFTSAGVFAGRGVMSSRLHSRPTAPNTLNTVALQWNATADSTYSLDVQTLDGTWIPTCLDAVAASSVTFNEVCTGAGDTLVHKADVAAFRINRLVAGERVATTTLAYDGYSDSLAATV